MFDESHGRDGKPIKTIEQYVIGRPAADEFIAPVLAVWKEKRAEALAAGVKDDQLVAELLAALGVRGGAVVPASNDGASDRDAVLHSVRQLVGREGPGALIPVRKLRAEL